MRGVIPPLPTTPSWRSARKRSADRFIFTLLLLLLLLLLLIM